MPIHTINVGCVTSSGSYATSTDVTEEEEIVVEKSITVATAVTLTPVAMTVSDIKSVVFYSTLACDVVPWGATAGTQFSLAAGVPLIWSTTASYGTTPFAGAASSAVTKLVVTCTGAATATPCAFTMRALINAN